MKAAVALLAVLAVPAAAVADTITMTSGSVETELALGLARVAFEGPGFSLRGGVEGFHAPIVGVCSACESGTTVDLGGMFSSTRAAGSGVVDGVTYPEINFDGFTGTFSSPAFTLNGMHSLLVTQPFSFEALVSGYLVPPFVRPTDPVFTKTLKGSGVATAQLAFIQDVGFIVNDLRYDFGPAAATPEPATLTLLGSGVGALLAARWRRRRSAAPVAT